MASRSKRAISKGKGPAKVEGRARPAKAFGVRARGRETKSRKEQVRNSLDSILNFARLPEATLQSIEFSILNDDILEAISATTVVAIGSEKGRLGAMGQNELCATCDQDRMACTGHLGRIALPKAQTSGTTVGRKGAASKRVMIYREDENYDSIVIVSHILQSLCPGCWTMILNEDELDDIEGYDISSRVAAIAEKSRDVPCRECDGYLPIKYITAAPNDEVIHYFDAGNKRKVHSIDSDKDGLPSVSNILAGISEKYGSLFGFDNRMDRYLIAYRVVQGMDAPIYQYPFIDLVADILGTLCPICGEMVLDDASLREFRDISNRYARVAAIAERSKGVACKYDTCGGTKPLEYLKRKPEDVYIYYMKKERDGESKKTRHDISRDQRNAIPYRFEKIVDGEKRVKVGKATLNSVRKTLEAIKWEDAERLGFRDRKYDAPRHLVRYFIPVIPSCMRRDTVVKGQKKTDALTELYNALITQITKYKESSEGNRANEYEKMVQAAYQIISNPEKKKAAASYYHRAGITQILEGKGGVIRDMMLGRRTNFSARAVASPAPHIPFGKIAVPSKWRRELPIPEDVDNSNVHRFIEMRDNGLLIMASYSKLAQYSSRHRIFKPDAKFDIKPGMVVYRELEEGDVVYFNRNPSIAKHSIMAAEVTFWDNLTVGLPLIYMKTIAGDFDGDEINIHVLQNPKARAEARDFMLTTKCRLNSSNSLPVFSFNQDVVAGVYGLSQRSGLIEDIELDEDQYNSFVERYNLERKLEDLDPEYDEIKVPKRSPKRLISAMLPEDFKFENGSVKIADSIINKGVIDLETLGEMRIRIQDEYEGAEEFATYFFDSVRWIIGYWIDQSTKLTLSPALFDMLVATIEPPPDIRKMRYKFSKYGIPKYSGRRIISYVLPDNLNFVQGDIVISEGVLVSGVIDSSAMKKILDRILNYSSEIEAAYFYTNSARVFETWFRESGASISLAECIPGDIDAHRKEIMQEANRVSKQIIELGPEMEDPLDENRRQQQMGKIVGASTDRVIEIVKRYMPEDSTLLSEIQSGAKGSIANLNSIFGWVGQLIANGGIPQKTGPGRRVTFFGIPEVTETGDDVQLALDPTERQFCTGNYGCGLNPREEFAVFVGGREANTSNALSTPVVGNIRRNIAELKINLVVRDGLVKDGEEILQFGYGSDMMNPDKMTKIGDTYVFVNPQHEMDFFTNQVIDEYTRIAVIVDSDPNVRERMREELDMDYADGKIYKQILFKDFIYDVWVVESELVANNLNIPNDKDKAIFINEGSLTMEEIAGGFGSGSGE